MISRLIANYLTACLAVSVAATLFENLLVIVVAVGTTPVLSNDPTVYIFHKMMEGFMMHLGPAIVRTVIQGVVLLPFLVWGMSRNLGVQAVIVAMAAMIGTAQFEIVRALGVDGSYEWMRYDRSLLFEDHIGAVLTFVCLAIVFFLFDAASQARRTPLPRLH